MPSRGVWPGLSGSWPKKAPISAPVSVLPGNHIKKTSIPSPLSVLLESELFRRPVRLLKALGLSVLFETKSLSGLQEGYNFSPCCKALTVAWPKAELINLVWAFHKGLGVIPAVSFSSQMSSGPLPLMPCE